MDSIDYEFAQWGPYLSKMVIDKSIVDRLLEDGNELRIISLQIANLINNIYFLAQKVPLINSEYFIEWKVL